MPESKFIRIRCPRCKKPQITYGKASTWVKCKSCNKLLMKPRGGKAKVRANIRTVLTKFKIQKISNPFENKTQETEENGLGRK